MSKTIQIGQISRILLVSFILAQYMGFGQTIDSLLETRTSTQEKLDLIYGHCDSLQGLDLDYEGLIRWGKIGLDYANELHDHEREAQLCLWIIRSHKFLEEGHMVSPYSQRVLDLFDAGRIKSTLAAEALYNEIYTLLDYAEYELASEKLSRMETLGVRERPRTEILYHDLQARLRTETGFLDEAEQNLLRLLELALEGGLPRHIFIAYHRLGKFHLEYTHDYIRGLEFVREGEAYITKHQIEAFRHHLPLLRGQIYLAQKDIRSFQQLMPAIDIERVKVHNNLYAKDYWTLMGDYYLLVKKDRSGIAAFEKAIANTDESLIGPLSELHQKQAKAFQSAGDLDQAFAQMEIGRVLADSLNRINNQRVLAFYTAEVQNLNNIAERNRLERKITEERSQKQVLLILASALLIGLTSWLWIVRRYNKRLTNQVKERTDHLEEKSVELEKNLGELRQFNYIASHDIKEPMRVIGNIVTLIQRKLKSESPDPFTEEFDIINSNLKQLYTLLEDISNYNQFLEYQPRYGTVDVDALISDVLALLQPSSHIKIVRSGLPSVHSNHSLLTIIFKNLLDNAIKFNDSPQPQLVVKYRNEDEMDVFSVSDNGPGIAPDYQDQIFTMFKRLHGRETPGSGMGLGIVRNAVEKLGGSISVVSAPDKGATFIIRLPSHKSVEKPLSLVSNPN